MLKKTFILFVALWSIAAKGQNWSTFIDSSRAVDWSGTGASIPVYSVPCSTQPTLVTPDATSMNIVSVSDSFSNPTHTITMVVSGTPTTHTTSGEIILVAGVTANTGYNGTYVMSGVSGSTITYTKIVYGDTQYSSGGAVGTAKAVRGTANQTSIQNALASCDSTHNVVNLPAGTYYTGGITYGTQGSEVLRGAGSSAPGNTCAAGSTCLLLATTSSCTGLFAGICMNGGLYNSGSAATQPPSGTHQCSWTAGYSKGTTSITLNSCGANPTSNGLSVGSLVVLDQSNDLTDNGGIYLCDSFTSSQAGGSNCTVNDGSPTNGDGRQIGGYTYSQKQIIKVTSISGSGTGPYTVGITPGVYFNNVRTGQSPGAWWPGNFTNEGLENVYLDGTQISPFNVEISGCYKCWVKGISSYNSERAHVLTNLSLGTIVRDSYFFQSQSHATESYGVEFESTSGELVENNIFQQLTSPIMTGNTSGSVVGYNLMIGGVYVNSNYLQASYPSHNAGNDMNLIEGNNILNMNTDDTWGSSNTQTYFRNFATGWQYQSSPPLYAGPSLYVRSYSRVHNIIGNVFGQPGWQTNYEAYATSTSGGTNGTVMSKSIYSLGWTGYAESTAGTCSNVPFCDPVVRPTLMRWGNYDTVNAATQWNSTEAAPAAVTYVNANFTTSYFNSLAHTLPASLYYSSAPAWWPTGKAWPPTGPDVTTGNIGTCSGGSYPGAQATSSSQCTGGSLSTAWASHTVSLPAQDCYLSMSGPPDGSGNMLGFSASTCYYPVLTQSVAQNNHIGFATGQQLSTANWGNCGSTACAGGAGNSTGFTMTTGVVSPSVSGSSMALAFSSPAAGNNGLFYMKPGSCDTCYWVLYDFWWYPSSAAANHEADSFIFNKTNGDWDSMFGHQCNTTTGHWQYANQSSSWTDTSMSCSNLTAGAWHHVIFYDWYFPSDTSCTGSVPCQHFGTVTVDGSTQSWGGVTMPVTVLNPSYSGTYGCQVQEDSNAAATVTMYVDNFNCWTGR